jgi:hypothetical protein
VQSDFQAPRLFSIQVERVNTACVELRSHVWICGAAVVAGLLLPTESDPDLWGHLRFGLDSLRTRTLPFRDPYSFTQDRPWVNHEWLSEAAMAVAYKVGGPLGLIGLKVAVLLLVLAILARRLRGATPLVTSGVVILAMICVLPISLTVRPQLWSVLGLALLLALLAAPEAPTPRRMFASALLFALWANLHGGWITGAAVLCLYAVLRVWREPAAGLRWGALVACALAATILNPYGVGLWQFLLQTVRSSRPDITEWQPVRFTSPSADWLGVLAPLLIAFSLTIRRKHRPPVEVWAVLLLLITAGMRVSRVVPLMVPACLVLLAPYIRGQWGNRGALRVSSTAGSAIFWIPVLVVLAGAARSAATSLSCIPDRGAWVPDRVASAWLEGASGRLWTTFNWGEYAIWHFGPRLQVSVDGRRETVYSDAVVQTSAAFERLDAAATTVFLAWRPDFVWLPAADAAVRVWLQDHGYRIDASTERSFIAVRQDLPVLPQPSESPRGCFP